MIIKKMLLLFFTLVGFVASSSFAVFLISRSFREFMAVRVLKATWPEKLGGAFCEDFFQASSGAKSVYGDDVFSKMGALLELYDSAGNTPEISAELRQLQAHLKEYYKDLKSSNVPPKKLRSVAYQIGCIQAIIDAEDKNGRTDREIYS